MERFMKHCGTQTLETERLILRRFTVEDAAAMYRNWASDDEVTKYMTWPAHTSEEVTQSLLQEWVERYADETCYQWAIVLKEIGEPVGSISVVSMKESLGIMDVGYCIGKRWWHQGITSEALKAVMNFLFDTVGANRIEAQHDPKNPNSGKVMQKCGMQYEGTQRSAGWNNQGICDLCCYALLKWERCTRADSPQEKYPDVQNGVRI